ncbi:MAG: glycosyltransferase family 32 protein [Anaerobutyricum sp.]
MIQDLAAGIEMSIPKILHYCWFGNSEFPKREQKCINSWKKYLSDFEMRCWNEENFDVQCNPYVREAYQVRRYEFVSDYCRLLALYNEGGLYLDTDCLVKKDFTPLMIGGKAFTGYGGDNYELAAHALAFPPKHPFIKECLESYDGERFLKEDGSYNKYTINQRMTNLLKNHGFIPNGRMQEICNIIIYPMTYFCPISMLPDTVRDCKSKNTYCIHVWSSKELKRERNFLIRFAHKTGLNKIKRKLIEVIKK